MNTQLNLKHPLYKYLLVLLALSVSAWLFYRPLHGQPVVDRPLTGDVPAVPATYRIQLAILLDTSSSMDGLIDQARNQLWRVVNEFANSRKQGITPTLQVAVYEYGNSGLPVEGGYIRRVTGLTQDLDSVSEALFSLTTNGGEEYCGQVIEAALGGLEWSDSPEDIRAIFIAGNEPFTQGPVSYRSVLEQARQRGITVNTIHAGDYNDGIQGGWEEGALLAGGSYMSIDQDREIAQVSAPQDDRILVLNRELNATYVPYGSEADQGVARQAAMDATSQAVSPAVLARRTRTKSSALYNNESWDLVDAMASGAASPEELRAEDLPAEMRGMDDSERRDYVERKASEREQIKKEIAVLSQAREAFVASQQGPDADDGSATLDQALFEAVKAQGEKQGYSFGNQ